MKLRERTGFRAVLGVLALLLGISGCTSSDDPTTSPSSTASGPASTSTTVEPSSRPTNIEPPARPPAMDNPDEAGAIAAAEYFLRLTVYAAATGDTAELEAMSGEGCKGCSSYISSVNDLYDQGGWWTSVPEVTISSESSRSTDQAPNQFQVELDATKEGYEYFNGEGELRSVDPESVVMGFVVTYANGWRVDIAQSFPEGTEIHEE